MNKNPYQSPQTESWVPDTSKHRSFRLTQDASEVESQVKVVRYRDAVIFAVVLQVPCFFLSAMMLDGGLLFKRIVISSVAFWCAALIIMIRRGGTDISDSDILLVKWGYLPILLLVWALSIDRF